MGSSRSEQKNASWNADEQPGDLLMPEIVTFGEAMLRLSVPPGQPLTSASAVDLHVAGSEANVAITLGNLGHEVSWVSKLPDGPLGRRVISTLRGAGVDCSHVQIVPDSRLGVYYVELQPQPLPTRVIYDRGDSAASAFGTSDIPWDLVEEADVVHLSGITPALSPTCLEASLAIADRVREADQLLSVDVNYRAKLWDVDEAASALSKLMTNASLLVCTSEDAHQLFGASGQPHVTAAELADRFQVSRVVITSGEDGAWWKHDDSGGHIPAMDVTVIDRIGAGDAFVAGVLDGVLDDDLETGVLRGTALAAMALATRGDHPSVSRTELEDLLAGPARRVDR